MRAGGRGTSSAGKRLVNFRDAGNVIFRQTELRIRCRAATGWMVIANPPAEVPLSFVTTMLDGLIARDVQ